MPYISVSQLDGFTAHHRCCHLTNPCEQCTVLLCWHSFTSLTCCFTLHEILSIFRICINDNNNTLVNHCKIMKTGYLESKLLVSLYRGLFVFVVEKPRMRIHSNVISLQNSLPKICAGHKAPECGLNTPLTYLAALENTPPQYTTVFSFAQALHTHVASLLGSFGTCEVSLKCGANVIF